MSGKRKKVQFSFLSIYITMIKQIDSNLYRKIHITLNRKRTHKLQISKGGEGMGDKKQR